VGDLMWQSDKSNPVWDQQEGATPPSISGTRNVDGVQPDDQRRTPAVALKGNSSLGRLGDPPDDRAKLRKA
jgi:hypothetical protein